VLPEERCGNGSLCAGRQEPLSYVGQALLGIEDGWASSDHFDGPELLAVSAHFVDGVRPAAAAALDNADRASVLGTTPVDTAVIGHLRANGEPIELSTRFATVPTDTRSPYNTAHLRCIRSRKVPQKYSG
jgi:hypothetical protein